MTESSLQDLQRLVDSFLEDQDETNIKTLLDQALSNYERYRKEVVKPDYKAAFINYNLALGLVVKTIPCLPRFEASGKNFKSTYSVIKETIITDEHYIKVKAHYHETNFITATELYKILQDDPDDVLLIDFRAVDQFKRSHVNAHKVINIDPISVRKGYTDSDIENFSLLGAMSDEREIFSKRAQFKFVIIYDNDSTSIDFLNFYDPLVQLYNALTTRAFDQRLRNVPFILQGGMENWFSKYGITMTRNHHGNLTQIQPLAISRPSSKRSLVSPIDSPCYINSFNDLLSHPVKTDFSKTISIPPQKINKKLGSLNISSQPDLILKPKPLYPTPTTKFNELPAIQLPHSSLHRQTSMSQPSLPLPKHLPSRISSPPHVIPPACSLQADTTPISLHLKDLHCATGFANLGNSCYMNSVMQCLFGTTVLFGMFLKEDYKQYINTSNKLGSRGLLTNSVSTLAKQVYSNKNNMVRPIDFKSAVSVLNKNFKNFDQQDACEFLSFILDTLHEDLNGFGSYPKLKPLTEEEEQQREKLPFRYASFVEWERYLKTNFSFIVNLFQGQYASQLKCLECESTSTTFQAFTVLSLPIPETVDMKRLSLDDCIKEFTKTEILDGDDKWSCPHCKKKVRTSKKITITRLPPNLIIHIKRFKPNLSKITHHIFFPHQLDLSYLPPTVSSPEEEESVKQFPLREQIAPFRYNLYAVVNHIGNFNNGHYTSYVWKGIDTKWCYFDDSSFKKNIKSDKVINSNAYILFYCRY